MRKAISAAGANAVSDKRKRGQPRKRGPAPRSPVPTDPAIDERQTRAFELSLQGLHNGSIAQLLGVGRSTVATDLRMETARRAQERAADRATTIERSVSRYEKIIGDSSLRVSELRTAIAQEPSWKAKAQYRTIITREMAIILKAQRQAEEVQGLLVTVNVDASTTNVSLTVGSALDAFAALPPDVRAEMRAEARARRALAAPSEIKNVTPS